MIQHEQVHSGDENEIHAVATSMLARRRWQLVAADDLAHSAEQLLRDGVVGNAGLAVLNAYTQALYRACAGLDGLERQQRGFIDLFQYLQDCAWRFAGDLGTEERAEVVNQALAEIYYRFIEHGDPARYTAVRNPNAFLWLSVQQLRNVIRKWHNNALPPWDVATELRPGPAEHEPEHFMAGRELSEQVRLCFARSLQHHKKARLQLLVVWMRYIEGMEYADIGTRLDMSVANVRVLHSRGLGQLRKDPQWHILGHEIGLAEVPIQH